jgi:long-chain fatty acid transport protein
MTRNVLLAATLCVLAARPAGATNGMRMTGFGPVQNSMGGVGVGATLDAASIVTNPAGMAELGGRIDFGATYFKPSPEYKATGLSGEGIPPGLFIQTDGKTIATDRGASPVPVFGIAVPLDRHWNVGLGAYGVAGMGVDYAPNLYGGTTFTSYSQMRFTPAVAYKLNDMVSFGATINVMWATMEWNVAGGVGQAPHTTAQSFGVGATLGVKVTPIKELTLGAAYETRSFFADFSFGVAQRPNPFGGDPLPGGVDKMAFDQPQVVTLGAAAHPLDMLIIAADVEWINWAQTNGENLPTFNQNQSMAQPWNLNWSNQLVLKLGVEVEALPELRIRAGYNFGKMPLDSSRAFENIAFPAVSEHHIMGGVGVSVTDKLGINVGFMFAPAATLTGSNAAPPPPLGGTGQGIVSYETKMSQWAIDAGLAYKF